jgi:periplasmic divalent cation tolerance protein
VTGVDPARDGEARGVLLVLTNCPDEATAARIRHELVAERLAACVNQVGPVLSTYRWQGSIEEASEVTLLIKTTRERYLALEARLRQLHPYSVPEIVAIPVERGGSEYLAWVDAETRAGLGQTE